MTFLHESVETRPPIKVLSLHQPYASLIASGLKTIETRSWSAPASLIGKRIAIHAAGKRPKDVWHHTYAPKDLEFPPPLAAFYDYGRCVDPQESNDGDWWRYRWAGPLGAIVATARLVECVRMLHIVYVISEHPEVPWPNIQLNGADCATLVRADNTSVRLDDQIPYGDFKHGRWGWILDDVQPLDNPVPFKGGQGLSRSWVPA